MTKIQQVRKEYGESFKEVVIGFAEQGNSKRLTAATLGINSSYFLKLLDRFELHGHFRPKGEQRPECQGGWPKGKPNIAARRRPIEHNGMLWYPCEPTYKYLTRQETK